MLSVRLTSNIEKNLTVYCNHMHVTKSQEVQEAAARWLTTAKNQMPRPLLNPTCHFLSVDDPIRIFIGIAKDDMSTDKLTRITRG